ncbi:unnamed protein product, partial [Allacma fusca]
MQMLAVQCS